MKGIVFSLVMVVTALMMGPAFAREPGTPAEPEATSAKSLFSFKTDNREPIFGDRFTVKAGYKVWVAKWQAQIGANTTTQTQFNSDHPSAMNGPTVTGVLRLRESPWFNALVVNFTWLRDGFDFAENSDTASHIFANRRDYTVTAGLTIWEGFGIFGGYYHSRQEITDQPNASPVAIDRYSRNLSGPIFGVFGNGQISERISLYGNLAYAALNYKGFETPPFIFNNTDAVQGFMNEVGVTVTGPRVWKIGTEVQVGFRSQIVQKNFGASATGSGLPGTTNKQPLLDVTYGPIFSISAVF